MNKDDYNKLIKELQKEAEKNKELIDLYKEKINILQFNQFKNKFKTFFLFAALGYASLFLLFLLSTSITYIPLIIIIGSVLIGVSGQKILYGLGGVKRKLREFSNAKNDKEKRKEEIVNAIELEKLKNKNESINHTIQKLTENRDFLEQL